MTIPSRPPKTCAHGVSTYGHVRCEQCLSASREPSGAIAPTPGAKNDGFKPATDEEAARLIDFIDELAARVCDSRAMGVGDVSIANGIRAQFMDRWIEEWSAAIPPRPLSEELLDRVEAARNRQRGVHQLVRDKYRLETEAAALRSEVETLRSQLSRSLEISEAEYAAIENFMSYGATRGNHSWTERGEGTGPPPGPLTPYIDTFIRFNHRVAELLRAARASSPDTETRAPSPSSPETETER